MEALLRSCFMHCCPWDGMQSKKWSKNCNVPLQVAFVRRGAFWHVIWCQKTFYSWQQKSLSFLVFFFFPGQMIFPVRDVSYANQGGTTRKKALKAITPINSAHWGIPAYHLSFLFSVLYKIVLCLCFLTVFNVCPARPLAYELQCACILQGSVSVCTNKRQRVLEIGVNSPWVSAWSCIDLVLSEVQARHEPRTTDCHMPVVVICLERWSQKPQERRKGKIKRKKKPAKSLPSNLNRSRIWPEAPQGIVWAALQ